MRKILLPILSTIFSLTTLLAVEKASAQTKIDTCHNLSNCPTKLNLYDDNTISLSQERWHKLMKKYYETRYRTKFKENNSFLSLNEVNKLIGFSGKRSKIKKGSSHQYLSWQDPQDPRKKIEGVFIYHHLVGLRSKGFDRLTLQKIQVETRKSAIAR